MKTKVRCITYMALCLSLAFGTVACSTSDGYSLDNWERRFATVGKDNRSFTIDNGKTVFAAAPLNIGFVPKYKRVIIDYTPLYDNYEGYDLGVKLLNIYDVLTKPAVYIDPANTVHQDSIGNEPLKVISMAEGGGYINIAADFYTYQDKQHLLNLVSNEPIASSVQKEVVTLHFRHGLGGGRPGGYPVRSYVCFDLAAYDASPHESITFEINVKGYDKPFEIKYKPHKAVPVD